MVTLAVLAVFLALATAWWLARPLARADDVAGAEEAAQLALVRERLVAQLNELEVEVQDRNIDAAVVGDERRRLEAELAQVLKRLEALGRAPAGLQAVPVSRRAWVTTLAVLALALPLVAGGLYVLPRLDILELVATGHLAPRQSAPPDVQKMVERLEQRLVEQPGDAAGWARLGRSYAVLGRLADAEAAYAKAARLAPSDVETLSEYAWLLVSSNQGNPTPAALELYQRLLKLDPDNVDALWFVGFAAYQKGDYDQAVTRWERLARAVPPDNPAAEQLQAALAKAREKRAARP